QTVAGGRAVNGSGWLFTPQAHLLGPDGVWHGASWDFPIFSEDANGNQIVFSSQIQPNGDRDLFDSLGRSIVPLSVVSSSTTTDPHAASDFSGCTGLLPIVHASIVSLPGKDNINAQFKLCFAEVPILTNFGSFPEAEENQPSPPPCGTPGVACDPVYSLQSVVQPDGTAWTFEYNSRDVGDPANVNYGDLTKVTFPTGGVISYAWENVAFPSCNINAP